MLDYNYISYTVTDEVLSSLCTHISKLIESQGVIERVVLKYSDRTITLSFTHGEKEDKFIVFSSTNTDDLARNYAHIYLFDSVYRSTVNYVAAGDWDKVKRDLPTFLGNFKAIYKK
jgi:hypothetical protein